MSIPNADHVNLLLSAAFAPMQPADMGEFDRDAEGILGFRRPPSPWARGEAGRHLRSSACRFCPTAVVQWGHPPADPAANLPGRRWSCRCASESSRDGKRRC